MVSIYAGNKIDCSDEIYIRELIDLKKLLRKRDKDSGWARDVSDLCMEIHLNTADYHPNPHVISKRASPLFKQAKEALGEEYAERMDVRLIHLREYSQGKTFSQLI